MWSYCGPNDIYFALGITEGRPAEAFWADKIHIRSAHAADPVYSLRQNPLRQLNFETPFPRFYRAQKTGGTDGACAPFGERRALRARTGGRALRARSLGGMGPWGPLGLFRSHSEWKAISNGELLRKEAHSEMKTVSKEIHPEANGWKLKRNLQL